MSLKYGPAGPEDAPAIVGLIQEGFPREFLAMTTMGCSGSTNYCRLQIDACAHGGDSHYHVALLEDEIVGCIELRSTVDTIFINYVSVASKARSRGIASELLSQALNAVHRPPHRSLELDVLEDNHIARRWYDSLGFQHVSASDWHEIRLKAGERPTSYISGLPQASTLHQAFGFSQIAVSTKKGTYQVGRLGDDWLRITSVDLLTDTDAIGTLGSLYPDRNLLLIAPAGTLEDSHERVSRLRARTVRMRMDLAMQDILLAGRGKDE